MEERNTLPWPSIEQLPKDICGKIKRHLAVCETAAVCLQRTWRRIKGIENKNTPGKAAFAGGYGGLLHSRLLRAPTFCSEKLDGTNVGKTRDGKLLGRRMVISAASEVYMKCPLRPLRECETDGCLDELKETLVPDGKGLQRCAFYGELCWNPGFYNYDSRNLGKSWQVFGAIFEFCDTETASAAAANGTAKSLTCLHDRDTPTCVLVANTPALSAMLARHGIAAVESESFASLCELVAAKKKWMMSECGEGVVLTLAEEGKPRAYKWKISREPQPVAIKELTETIRSLKPGGPLAHKAMLLSAHVHTLLADLLDVATHVDSASAKEKSAPTKKTAPEQGAKARALDPADVKNGISSALTKFDVFDAAFSAKGKGAIPQISAMLVEEVLGDKALPMPVGEKEKEKARKEVTAAVRLHVGEDFGRWQRAQAEAGANQAKDAGGVADAAVR
mmetsp:Transcript_20110/g.47898  ORF Transcript_20110/g.47898 Transcript_20110/m.47898 type:complete len:449 (+) Transcript_20110:133-1479(+)